VTLDDFIKISWKFDEVFRLLEDLVPKGHRIVVFSKYKMMLNLLEFTFDRYRLEKQKSQWQSRYINGDMKSM
jgi:SNF2 family DNA or RNA helicase